MKTFNLFYNMTFLIDLFFKKLRFLPTKFDLFRLDYDSTVNCIYNVITINIFWYKC